MKKTKITFLIALMLLAVSYINAQTTIYPTMDTFIHQQAANAGVAQNSNNPNVLEVRSSGSLARIAFMDIPVSSISSFSAVSSAILNLYLQTAATSTDNVEVYQVTAQGVTIDNSTTWNSLYPSGTATYTLGSSLGTITVTNGNAVNTNYSFNLTSFISSLTPGTQKVTLCLKATGTNGPKDFWSVDYTTQAYRPALVVSTSSVAVTGVTVSPSTATVAIGATTNLTATVAPSNAANKTVNWTSSNTGVATVSVTGVVTGVSGGSATITATTQDGSFTSTSSITVPSTVVSVTGVTVSPSSTSVNIGATTNLTATVAPTDATNKTVNWTSSNTGVATVSAGVVTGVAAGTATITATTQDGSFTSTSTITVTTVPVTGVTVSPSSTTVVAGAYIPLTATVAPSNANNKTVNWTSSNNSVAKVSVGGVVTGISAGTATITATTQDGSFTSTSSVTVSAPASNYALNPDFELNGAPAVSATNWYEWSATAGNIDNSSVVVGNVGLGNAVGGSPHSGTYYIAIAPTVAKPTGYDVLNKQDLTGLPNGTYTLKVWFRANGGSGYLNVGAVYNSFNTATMSQWTQYTINNISVTNGTATININYTSNPGGYELDIDDVQLTLNQMVLVTGINAVSPASKTLSLNETTTLTTSVIPGNASNSVVNWSSSNVSVATVSAAGIVTAVSAGTATITATTVEGGFTSTSAITVANNYVLNPSFEKDNASVVKAADWSEWSGTPAYTDNSNVITGNVGLGDVVGGSPHSGTYYIEVAPTVANSTTYGLLNFQSIANIPNGTYTLTGWFRGNGGSGYLNVGAAYNNFNFATLSQWTKLTINDVVISTGTCQIQVNFSADNGQKLDIDDIVFAPKAGDVTSTALVAKNSNISIYPTVIANNVLNISNSVKGNYEVSISNINGQAMYTNKLNSGNVSINTSFLKTGMYLVRVSNGIENYVQKVIIP